MAARKYYHLIHKNWDRQTVEFPMTYFELDHPSATEPWDKLIKIINQNYRLSHTPRIFPNHIGNELVFNDIQSIMDLTYFRLLLDSSKGLVEVCPFFDHGPVHNIRLMVRYYEDENLHKFEEILSQFYTYEVIPEF